MNYGLPTIVNANGSMADLPADAVWLLPDVFDDAQLVDALVVLHRDASKRAALSVRARQHILTQHNPRTCAEQYAQAIESAYNQAQLGLHGLLHALPVLNPALTPSEYPALAGTLAANFPPSPRRRQLLLDVSALVNTDLWSGIERVTRALLTEVLKAPPTGWAVEPVYATADQPGYRYARKFTSRFLNLPDEWAEDAPVQVWQGDFFLGLDLQPQVVAAQEQTLQSWRNRGVKCFFVIYDLLPVTMPEVFPDGARDGHQRWLQTVSRFDGALCISRAVADEMFDWLQTFGETRKRPFALDWFHLGADVDNSAPSLGLPGDAAQTLAALKARPSFLMVGTIEPRKGYLQTLQAFDALWAQGVDVNLVIVGKEGWKPLPDDHRRDIPQTVQALRNHAERGKRLFWLEGISDEYLEQIYAHAACLIAASFDEGFGLPLIEAARHGVPLLVRDIPVFREVTDGHAYYFADRREPQVIQDAIQQWLALFEQGTHPRSTAMPHQTWSESAQQVLDGVFARTAPYKTWLPDGVRRYWGADPRMLTEVGERRGIAIHASGKAGSLIHGPYLNMDAGNYRVVFSGKAYGLNGKERFDVCTDSGKKIVAEGLLSHIESGHFDFILDFFLESNKNDIEFRLSVEDRSQISLQKVEIINLP
jgi:glycosyltransferase involved in cell wall biosynthesis